MRFAYRPWRQKVAVGLVASMIAGTGHLGPAMAFDLFGLFGSETPPAPSPTTLPYELTFEVRGDDSVEGRLQQASNLYRLRLDAPPDGDTLLQRANADFAPLIDALWGAGYYDATLTIAIAGVPVQIGQFQNPAAVRAANALRNRAPVPVRIVAETARSSGCATSRSSTGRPGSRFRRTSCRPS
jgi:translocation and assembly module TamA